MRIKSGLLSLAILSLLPTAYAGTQDESIRIIIKYKNNNAPIEAVKQSINAGAALPIQALTALAGSQYLLVVNSKDLGVANQSQIQKTEQILEKIRQNPEVVYAVRDRVGHFTPTPAVPPSNDFITLSHDLQWDEFKAPGGVFLESAPGLMDGAWAHTLGDSQPPVVVAVLDTGIALNDSLINNLVKDANGDVWGWNFADNNRDLRDQTGSWHGTHVAGTIAGYGHVMSGMGPQLKILPLKIPGASGMFYESQVINAIYWSVGANVPGIPTNPYPAKVLNMSFGVDIGPGKELDICDEALQDAVSYAKQQGAVLAVAAGNDNLYEHFNAPAVCNGTIRVASTGPEGLRAYYSNHGPGISFAAPGGDMKYYGRQGTILSTVNPGGGFQNSGFDFYQGTSMASPHVAGLAGLIYAMKGSNISAEAVENIIRTTTHDFGITRDKNRSCVGTKPCGHGIIDANNAVAATLANYDLLFSAPVIENDNQQSCAEGRVKAKAEQMNNGSEEWVLQSTDCQPAEEFARPRIEKVNNEIIAFYGSTRYQLNTKNFKSCHIIGFDGVGCYY